MKSEIKQNPQSSIPPRDLCILVSGKLPVNVQQDSLPSKIQQFISLPQNPSYELLLHDTNPTRAKYLSDAIDYYRSTMSEINSPEYCGCGSK